jgi:hypothetical protein
MQVRQIVRVRPLGAPEIGEKSRKFRELPPPVSGRQCGRKRADATPTGRRHLHGSRECQRGLGIVSAFRNQAVKWSAAESVRTRSPADADGSGNTEVAHQRALPAAGAARLALSPCKTAV